MDFLTPRQRDVVLLTCRDDLTHAETGARLGLAAQTIKNHVGNILRLFGTASMHGVCWHVGHDAGYAKAITQTPLLVPGLRSEQV